jgi:hypothetical protein
MDAQGNIKYPFTPYFGARLLTQDWLTTAGWHELYPVAMSGRQSFSILSAYAVHRPDDLWSVLLINKDPDETYRVQVKFQRTNRRPVFTFAAPLELFQYSSAQYILNNDASNPVPIRNDPPSYTILNGAKTSSIEVPPYSLTVLRGRLDRWRN